MDKILPTAATIWHLPLTEIADEAALLALLEPTERQRAERYRNAAARRNFLLCRAALRLLLAERLQITADALQLLADEHGKPHLADAPPDLSFNVSHSGDLALIALANGPPIGIDLEAWRPNRQSTAIARRCFAPAELSGWHALPETERPSAFFALWTRKEAFAKAVGRGISLGLERIVFGPEGDLIAVPPDCGKPVDWLVRNLDVGSGYSAAVALGDPAGNVELKQMVQVCGVSGAADEGLDAACPRNEG